MGLEEMACRLRSAAELETSRQRIDALLARLAEAPHWTPGPGLRAQGQQALAMLKDLKERLERKLVVVLIGPTGSGKSTLLNALAQSDRLSEVSLSRPTTRQVVVFCREAADAQALIDALGRERVLVRSSPAAAGLEHVILVDTPDTDSNVCPQHRAVLERLMQVADVLLCVFNAANPKRADNIDFLAPFVERFPHESLSAVLTHCDRILRDELLGDVLPDFRRHIHAAWGREPSRSFCVCARRHLQDPQWDAGAEPLHEFDEFPALRDEIFGSLNRAGAVVDLRTREAVELRELVEQNVAAGLAGVLPGLRDAAENMAGLRRKAMAAAIDSLRESGSEAVFGIDLMLHQRLAQLWWGPMGWLLAVWARLLFFGSGVFHLLRFGSPIRQLYGLVATAMRWWKSGKALDEAANSRVIEDALARYRSAVRREWTDVGKQLVGLGFDATALEAETALEPDASVGQTLSGLWESSLSGTIETTAQRLSNTLLQLAANLPVLFLLGLVAWQCVAHFVREDYLSADYFRHALVTIAIVWALSFALLQVLIRSFGGARILKRAVSRLLREAAQETAAAESRGLAHEIDALCSLGAGLNR